MHIPNKTFQLSVSCDFTQERLALLLRLLEHAFANLETGIDPIVRLDEGGEEWSIVHTSASCDEALIIENLGRPAISPVINKTCQVTQPATTQRLPRRRYGTSFALRAQLRVRNHARDSRRRARNHQ